MKGPCKNINVHNLHFSKIYNKFKYIDYRSLSAENIKLVYSLEIKQILEISIINVENFGNSLKQR